jgi:putative nucleotidyltransferase with HDIG domain
MGLRKGSNQPIKKGILQRNGRKGLKSSLLELKDLKNPSTRKLILALFLSLILAWLISPGIQRTQKAYRIGEVVGENIKAPMDFLVEDPLSTQKRIREAEEKLTPVYDYDDRGLNLMKERLSLAFGQMREVYLKELEDEIGRVQTGETKGDEPSSSGKARVSLRRGNPFRNKEIFSQKKGEFSSLLNINITDKQFSTLEKYRFEPYLVEYIISLIKPIWERGVVSNKELLLTQKEKGITLRMIEDKKERLIRDFSSILDLKEAREKISIIEPEELRGIDPKLLQTLREIAQGMIVPNITFNKKETEERRKSIRENVKPVYFQIQKGEMIVREGEKITEEHLIKLKGLEMAKKGPKTNLIFIGMTLLFFLLTIATYKFGSRHIKDFPKENRDFIMLACVLIIMVIFVNASLFIAKSISRTISNLTFDSLLYGIPFSSGAMLVCIILNPKIALIFGIFFSFLCSLCINYKIFLFIYPFVGGLIATLKVARCKQRTTILIAGLLVGIINVFMVIALNMITRESINPQALLMESSFALLGGLFSGIIVAGITPLIEMIFGYTTDIKYLELASLDKPIMRDLMMRAPGTYYHSVVVGNLVEAAAEAIGANPLLAKVSAYYHDLGKIKKPLYYIENQEGVQNPHDHLSPHMSSLILISHTKEGVELARRNRLGRAIIDIIQQHHGTNLISYFYQKAKSKEKENQQVVKEEDFRYPGPKPQTKEAGLVMLADAVEAASKTLTDPTPSRIKGLVQRIINQIFMDGQLDECELTFRDLGLIEESFTRILTGIFHHRIEYPEHLKEVWGQKRNHEDIHKRLTEKDQNGQEEDKRVDGNDIKRIGLPGRGA